MSESFYGLYSNSGFDLLAVLSKVSSRKNPTVDLGPIDLSCSFAVSDALKEDYPIIYVSSTFETLTGYSSAEILGKNWYMMHIYDSRFLQAPGGQVSKGDSRKFSDENVVYEMKKLIENAKECQFLNVNYKKSGEPFVNLITVIPVSLDDTTGIVTHFVGFQVDLLEQSNSILSRLSGISILFNSIDDKYVVNYNNQVLENIPDSIINTYRNTATNIIETIPQTSINLIKPRPHNFIYDFAKTDINESLDFVHILSSRGLILYASENFVSKHLGYDAREDLIGQLFSNFCHAGDLGTVMKELKGAELFQKISTMYRFKSKSCQYLWLDVIGQKCEIPSGKKIKCFILVGRMRQLPNLSHRMLLDNYVILNSTFSDLWMKISYQGLILFISKSETWHPFGPSNLYATKIYEHLTSKSSVALRNAIRNSTVFSPILISITTNSGEIIPLNIHPYPSIIFIRLKQSNNNGVQVSSDVLYPLSSLYSEVYLSLSPDTSMGYQFEMDKLQVSRNAFMQEIDNVRISKKRSAD